MKSDDMIVAGLRDFGLSTRQAKVYLEIIQSYSLLISEIAEEVKIPLQDIYGILKKLEKMGLVIRSIDKPSFVRAIPFEKALSEAIRQQKNEFDVKLQRMNTTISQIVQESELTNHYQENDKIDVGILKGVQAKDLAFRTVSYDDGYASENILRILTPWWSTRFPIILGRGGKIRQIIEVSGRKNNVKQTIEKLGLKGDIEFRIIRRNSNYHFSILDRHLLLVSLYEIHPRREKPALVTTEAEITRVYMSLFEEAWSSPDATVIYKGMK